MKKPITLYIPDYYSQKSIEGNCLKFSKIKNLLKEDNNNAMFIANIEKIENYQCNIPEISKEYQSRALKRFHEDREENWELPTKVNECKVYTYYWDDNAYHFRIYWVVISETYMLQLVGIFKPRHSAFYKKHFMLCGLDTEIDTAFDFSKEKNPENIFNYKKVEINIEELQERIDFEKEKKERDIDLKENFKISNSKFFAILKEELKEKEEAKIESFICTDWNMYYDLYNPENFSDPDSTIEWEDNSDVFDYYEKPFTDNSKVTITCYEEDFDISILEKLIENKEIAEQNLLNFFELYTFGNGGAYADAIYYKYAKIEIERLHNTTYSNQEFLKRNLCLTEIETIKSTNELKLRFACSWDTEHGIEIILNAKYECKTE